MHWANDILKIGTFEFWRERIQRDNTSRVVLTVHTHSHTRPHGHILPWCMSLFIWWRGAEVGCIAPQHTLRTWSLWYCWSFVGASPRNDIVHLIIYAHQRSIRCALHQALAEHRWQHALYARDSYLLFVSFTQRQQTAFDCCATRTHAKFMRSVRNKVKC